MSRVVELTITDVAFGGSGIARAEGKAVFVPFTIDGERVSARITREKKQFAEAEVLDVLEPSADRTDPRCPYFGRCGGCAYQHISYERQLAIKERQVEQALRRIGKIVDPPMKPIVPSPNSYEYRNRITVHAEHGVVGFYRRDEHTLIDITHCPISQPEVNEQLARLRSRDVRDGHYTLRAHTGPRVFEQTNDAVGEALRELVASFFSGGERSVLIDAFCGSGFFAKRLVNAFRRVIGIERDRFAIAAAERDAAPNESYIAGDVDTELRRLLAGEQEPDAAVLVDPPAIGLSEEIRGALSDHPPQTLVYVSCNPATLARDLGHLSREFRIVSVTPLDMFPQTAEIEVAVHLERNALQKELATADAS